MPLQIVRNDITLMQVDAIVNAANNSLLGGGGVDGCIHRAAGPGLLAECRALGGCKTGDAKITAAYDLPCKYVIHTVGPRWLDGNHGESDALISCYRTSLQLALKHNCTSVAFPLISAGIFGYPKAEALQIAVRTISEFLMRHDDMTVYIVIFNKRAFQIGETLFSNIAQYIDDHYVDEHQDDPRRRFQLDHTMPMTPAAPVMAPPMAAAAVPPPQKKSLLSRKKKSPPPASLHDALEHLDESFSQMLLRKIDERGMKDSDCYKKANIDRKLFSKIRSDPNYHPSKPTALAFAIALELPLSETGDMLRKAGFALSHSNKFDIIVEYFIARGNYNIFEINEALFAFDQALLGG